MAAGRRTILLVEDEPAIAEPLAESLAARGLRPRTSPPDAADGLERPRRLRPDLVLLDLMLPDGSGFDVCREVRRSSQVPIIMLTARGDEADRVIGLELGADDYVVKPFSAREVVARVRAVLRRTQAAARAGPRTATSRSRSTTCASTRRRGTRDARRRARSDLTRKEFDLLALLMRSAGAVVTREQPHRRGLGRELVRLDEDARRPRQRPASQARRRRRRAALPAHRARRRLPLRRARRGAAGGASPERPRLAARGVRLRARAHARRARGPARPEPVPARRRRGQGGGGQPGPARRRERRGPRSAAARRCGRSCAPRPPPSAAGSSWSTRAGALLADSAGTGLSAHLVRQPARDRAPRWRAACRRARGAAPRSTRSCCSRRSRSSRARGAPAPCG